MFSYSEILKTTLVLVSRSLLCPHSCRAMYAVPPAQIHQLLLSSPFFHFIPPLQRLFGTLDLLSLTLSSYHVWISMNSVSWWLLMKKWWPQSFIVSINRAVLKLLWSSRDLIKSNIYNGFNEVNLSTLQAFSTKQCWLDS